MRTLRRLQTLILAVGFAALAPSAGAQQNPPSCDLSDLQPGLNRGCQLQVDGLMRSFDVEVPEQMSQTVSLVVDAHGFGGSSAQQRGFSGLGRLVTENRIVRIAPQGIGNSWNGSGPEFQGSTCCGQARQSGLDDPAFFAAAADAVERSLGITPAVRAVTGLSNGGAITNRSMCEISDRFQVFAAVSFQLPSSLEGCDPAPGTIYTEFHAVEDSVVPFRGNAGLRIGPADQVVAPLAQLRGCDATPSMTRLNANTTCQTFENCDGGGLVQMCTVTPGNHGLYPTVDDPDFSVAFDGLLTRKRAELDAAP